MLILQAAEYIVKFIVRSRKLSELSAPGKGRHEFEVSLNGLFSAVVKMMLNTSNDALLVQVFNQSVNQSINQSISQSINLSFRSLVFSANDLIRSRVL